MISTKSAAISIAFLVSLAMANTLAMSLEPNGTHRFGIRINNDRLLYKVENPIGSDRFFNFKFGGPENSPGPEITCVEIEVKDIFNQTHAYISSGGIGEKSIVVVLAVLHKTKFSYVASVYGL